MNERLKDFKEKEADQMNRIKEDYEIKVKAYREKYKQLEENEFNYLENEYNKIKDKMHDDYNTKITNLEMKLKSKQGLIDKQVSLTQLISIKDFKLLQLLLFLGGQFAQTNGYNSRAEAEFRRRVDETE